MGKITFRRKEATPPVIAEGIKEETGPRIMEEVNKKFTTLWGLSGFGKKKGRKNKISPQKGNAETDIADHTKNYGQVEMKMFAATEQVRNEPENRVKEKDMSLKQGSKLPCDEAPIPVVPEAQDVCLDPQSPDANGEDVAELAEDAMTVQEHEKMDVDKDDRLFTFPEQRVSATSKENDVSKAGEDLTDMKILKTMTMDDESMNVTEDVPEFGVNEVNEENAHPEDEAEQEKISPAEYIDNEERGRKRYREALHVDEDPTSPMKRRKQNARTEKKRKQSRKSCRRNRMKPAAETPKPPFTESHHAGADEPRNPKQIRKEKESPEQEKRRKRNASWRKRTRNEWEQAAENPEPPVTAPEICSDTDGGKHDCRPPDKEHDLMKIVRWALAFYGSLVFTFLTSTVVVKCILVVSISATGIAIYYLMITFKPVVGQHEKITPNPDTIAKKPPHQNYKSVRPKDDFKAKMIHRWVFFEIANYIPPKEDVYDKFVNFASIYLNPLEKSQCNGVLGYLNKLEDKGIISIGNYRALLELENHGQNHHILAVIREPEKHYHMEKRQRFVF
ncbi:DNA ligase 1-like isoform X2 [Argopecten irradians]|uniref:DNA ligase 1-like isoform X2 n=1 Tax=Argopecten irradians TaxID=31199 RepID=UPI003723EC28